VLVDQNNQVNPEQDPYNSQRLQPKNHSEALNISRNKGLRTEHSNFQVSTDAHGKDSYYQPKDESYRSDNRSKGSHQGKEKFIVRIQALFRGYRARKFRDIASSSYSSAATKYFNKKEA